MKTLKIAAAATVALLLASVAVAADEAKPKEKAPAAKLNLIAQSMMKIDRVKSAIAGLDLSDDQKQKLEKIRDEFESKRESIHQKIAEELTEDQKQTAKDALDKAQASGKMDRKFYETVEASLKLTDEQKQKLEPIGKEFQALTNDAVKQAMAVLTPEQKEKVQKAIGGGKKGKKKAEK